MSLLGSRLFTGEPLLTAVAAGRDHLSRLRHAHHPAVLRLQSALLRWDPGCLSVHGADGTYGAEVATAVRRFTAQAAGATPAADAGETGPRTVLELDRIQQAYELSVDVGQRLAELDAWLRVPVCGRTPLVSTSGVHVHRSASRAFAAFQAAVEGCSGTGSFVRIPVPYEAPSRPNLWLVYDGARLRAFCGSDCRLELWGPAVADGHACMRGLPGMPAELPPMRSGESVLQRVRVFATAVERTGFVRYAIARARRFIYVEDPPLDDESVACELAARLETLDALIVVLHGGEASLRRRRFLNYLRPFAGKVVVVDAAGPPRSGLWVFDDCVAAAGWVAFGDLVEPGVVAGLRTASWNDRLGPFAPAANARPAASVPYWRTLGAEAADAVLHHAIRPVGRGVPLADRQMQVAEG